MLSEINEDALPQILAHELGHAVEFGKRPKEWQTKYMDGAETAADLYASSLLFNCGISERGFSQYMGMDYDKKKNKGKDTRMPYTPDGGFRRDNFIKSEEAMRRAKSTNSEDWLRHGVSRSVETRARKRCAAGNKA